MSAFYDQASLVVVPSGYKSGKIYAQKPLTTDGQLTFTRASTATRVNASGLIETVASGVPRLDYLGSSCPKLLLEPQRTNTAFPSEDFSVFTGSAATISTNQAVAPDGATTADLIYPAGSGNFVGKYKALSAGTTGVVSCFVKQAGKRYAIIGTDNNATYTCIFDLQTATVVYQATNYTGKIESYGNGWYRISATYTASAGNIYPFIGVADAANGSSTVSGTNGLYIWGFQYEVNVSYPTTYIKTTSAAVTRLADAASKTGISSLLGQSEGSALLEIDFQRVTNTTVPFIISSPNPGTTTSEGYFYINGAGNLVFEFAASGILLCSISAGAATLGRQKLAFAYKNNDFVFYKNGTLVGTDNTGTVISGFDRISVGSYTSSGLPSLDSFNPISQALVFKTRLTNAQLAELTTL
jgi:hypothetical protein